MKNRTTAALLALLLGGIGAHRFYLGMPIWGVVYVLFCWTLVPALVAFFEALRFFFMSEENFQAQYGASALLLTPSGLVRATRDTHVKCPDCRELVLSDARKCRHCGSALLPAGA